MKTIKELIDHLGSIKIYSLVFLSLILFACAETEMELPEEQVLNETNTLEIYIEGNSDLYFDHDFVKLNKDSLSNNSIQFEFDSLHFTYIVSIINLDSEGNKINPDDDIIIEMKASDHVNGSTFSVYNYYTRIPDTAQIIFHNDDAMVGLEIHDLGQIGQTEHNGDTFIGYPLIDVTHFKVFAFK